MMTDYKLRMPYCELRMPDYELRMTDYELQMTDEYSRLNHLIT
jgi:hypothetical protein